MPEPAPPAAAEPPFSPTIALLTVARVWDAELTQVLRGFGLTTRTYGLLGHIKGTPGISFSELARRSRITVQSAHTAVARLLAEGLVQDATAHAGARSVLELTEDGSRLLSEVASRLEHLDDRLRERSPALADALREEMRRTFS